MIYTLILPQNRQHAVFKKGKSGLARDCPLPLQLIVGEIHRDVGQLLMNNNQQKAPHTPEKTSKQQAETGLSPTKPVEVGGPKGPEPTRYGDWEKAGRCSDF
jgi:hypothetical protein